MKKICYPLIVTDFDGTLLRSDDTIAPETRRAIEEYVAAGGIFVISSGRSFKSVSKMSKSLGLKGLASSFHGNYIADVETGEVILEGGLTEEESYEIALAFESAPAGNRHLHVYTSETFYSTADDDFLRFYESTTQTKGVVISCKASELIKQSHLKAKKIFAYLDPSERDVMFNHLKNRLGDRFYVSYSDKTLVEVSALGYSKGRALRYIAKHYDIPIEKTIGVGDSLNDLPMLEVAGRGIAVKNADDALKSRFTPFAYSNDENALGKIIETYGFTE